MADVTSFEDVPLPADKVWSVIGDFAGIRKWAVLVQSETLEDTPAGKVRVLTMGNGASVRELLVTTRTTRTPTPWPTTATRERIARRWRPSPSTSP